jgi:hypothetical protein
MRDPDEVRKMIEDQVVSKIRWGEDEEEVLHWLEHEKGIGGADAGRLVQKALRARSNAIRFRALMTLLFAGIGLLVSAGFFIAQLSVGVIVLGRGTAVMFVIGIVSAWYTLRSLYRLIFGSTVGPVDQV